MLIVVWKDVIKIMAFVLEEHSERYSAFSIVQNVSLCINACSVCQEPIL